MNRTSVIFETPRKIGLRKESVPPLRNGEVLVKTHRSGISPGTEILVYRGQFPQDLPVDKNIPALDHDFKFPLKYGYSTVGRVVETGPQVSDVWLDRMVFCFHPHESHFTVREDQLIPVPADIDPEAALFLPNMESAVNFLMDGRPIVGEVVVVCGQGVVGLLTTALLAKFPIDCLITLDRWPLRRNTSLDVGAHITLDPAAPGLQEELIAASQSRSDVNNVDLIYELSGNPEALNLAIETAGFDSRIVVGSWYGTKPATLDLGAGFHRNRIRFISSQVSTLAPEFSGRWSKTRRLNVAWEMIRRIKPADFITHRYDVRRAGEAFQLLDERPEEAIQIVLTYE
jgi:2-desacetyl-2-hydroxyethyl bacteriochlorophyllide A dehydrogenase